MEVYKRRSRTREQAYDLVYSEKRSILGRYHTAHVHIHQACICILCTTSPFHRSLNLHIPFRFIPILTISGPSLSKNPSQSMQPQNSIPFIKHVHPHAGYRGNQKDR